MHDLAGRAARAIVIGEESLVGRLARRGRLRRWRVVVEFGDGAEPLALS